jgi:hypothetical protein
LENNSVNGQQEYSKPSIAEGCPPGSEIRVAQVYRRRTGRCGFRIKGSNQVCNKQAGWGTGHLGKGRCKHHQALPRMGPPKGSSNALKHSLTRRGLLAQHRPSHKWLQKHIDEQFEGKGDIFYVRDLVQLEVKYCVEAMQMLEAEFDKVLATGTFPAGDLGHSYRKTYEEQRGRWFNRLMRLNRLYPQALEYARELGLEDADKTHALLVAPPPGTDYQRIGPSEDDGKEDSDQPG